MDTSLLALFLPEGILDYFEITGFERTDSNLQTYDKRLTISLTEKKTIPEEYIENKYKASGFMEPRVIEDYPIRNMLVSLSIKRRRWDVELNGKTVKISRDWNTIITQGTRKTKEFAAFLKELN
jgi:transposase